SGIGAVVSPTGRATLKEVTGRLGRPLVQAVGLLGSSLGIAPAAVLLGGSYIGGEGGQILGNALVHRAARQRREFGAEFFEGGRAAEELGAIAERAERLAAQAETRNDALVLTRVKRELA